MIPCGLTPIEIAPYPSMLVLMVIMVCIPVRVVAWSMCVPTVSQQAECLLCMVTHRVKCTTNPMGPVGDELHCKHIYMETMRCLQTPRCKFQLSLPKLLRQTSVQEIHMSRYVYIYKSYHMSCRIKNIFFLTN